jgi:prepilin-type processing-associated H-X9-DG protein
VGSGPLTYGAPYFGPVRRDRDSAQNTPSTYWGVIVPAEPPQARGGKDFPIRILDSITDGSSNTVVLGERWMRPDQYTGGAWNDDHGVMSALDQDGLRLGDRPPLPNALLDNACCDWWRDTRGGNLPTFGSRFGGPHPGGMTTLFVDGSVRSLNWSISQATFANLCRRDDGAAVNRGEVP